MRKIVTSSLFTFGFLGLLKILSIVPFLRMAADDFSSAVMARLGVWQSLVATYNNWIGRFSSILIETVFVSFLGTSGKIVVFTITTLLLTFAGFLFFFKRLFKMNLNNLYIYLLAIVSMGILYLLTPSKSESWYWLTGSVTYLWPIPLFLMGISYTFSEKFKKVDYTVSSVLIFISVACNETFGLLVVVSLLFLLTVSLFKKKLNKIIFYMFVSSLASFVIMYLAPGNIIRRQSYGSNPMSYLGSLIYSLKEGPEFIFEMVWDNLYFLLPLVFVLSNLFTRFKNSLTQQMQTLDALFANIFAIIVYAVLLSIVYMFPAFNNLGRVQPERSGIAIAVIVVMLVIGISFNIAQIINTQKFSGNFSYKLITIFASIFLFITSFTFTKTLASDVYTAKNYSAAYDAMIDRFKKASVEGDKNDIEVALPDPGLVAITLDPVGVYGYKNQALSEFYGIGKVITKEYAK